MVLRRGFSLMELTVAMAVAAIVAALAYAFHRDFGKALREGWNRIRFRQAEMIWTASLQRGLLEGKGLVSVSPEALTFLSRAGQTLRLEKGPEDSLLWNGKRPPIPVAEYSLRIEGPDCTPPLPETDPECAALLDSVDGDGDGMLSLEELDRDGDGLLQGRERRYIRLVEIRWRGQVDGPWRIVALHPRQLAPEPEPDPFFP
jgi:prepilin-type N-terminal cleavage/methylation domain-containing protein